MQSQEVAWRISGVIAGEVGHQAYQVPIINSHLLHYIICHLPLVFLPPLLKQFLENTKIFAFFILPYFACLFVYFLFARVPIRLNPKALILILGSWKGLKVMLKVSWLHNMSIIISLGASLKNQKLWWSILINGFMTCLRNFMVWNLSLLILKIE